jgi:dipeptidyl aminopeptidase/acylaminoacyl peptidase
MLSVVLAAVLHVADIARIVDLEEPALSADGKRVAALAISQDVAKAAYVNRLVLVDVATGRSASLPEIPGVAVPRWSPRGARLAFLARAADGATRQVFVRGEDGATLQLSHSRGDVVDAVWSPDGRTIAYVAADPQKPATFFYAGNNDYTATALTPPCHIWIVPASGGAPRRLTSGSWTVAQTDPGGIFTPQIAWTHDGRAITYTRVENTFSGDDERSTIWQVDVATRTARKLTAHAQFELTPAYSPDGSHLTYWYPLHGDWTAETTVRVVDGGGDRALAPALDRNVAASLWYPDGRHLLVCAADHTQNVAWKMDLAGRLDPLPLDDVHMVCDPYSSSTFDAGAAAAIGRDGAIAFVGTTERTARELYYLAPGASSPRRLTHFSDFLQRISLGAMAELEWNGPDGYTEDGVVTYPPAFDAESGKKYPVVLLIHGGPGLSSQRDFVWEQWPQAQIIASHGYVVFQPNYRGSDNLGNAYMTAIVHNTVVGPSADILAGLAALEHQPGVDGSRVAVAGWSYGGELTSWLIGHDHRWFAAISGAAVNSEFEEYNLSTSNVQDRYPLGTSPYVGGGWQVYHDNSPITYYAQITTPTLIWGTTQDPVVPITQSYALYHALTDNHVPVRFAVFPAASHGPADPRQTAALSRLWLDWLDAHVK